MTTPMTNEPHGRAMRIAAIHAFADWLADHPNVPIPTSVIGTFHVDERTEIDEWTRVASVLSVLHAIGAPPTEGDRTVQGDLQIASTAAHGIDIMYRAAAHKDRRPDRRYVTREAGR
jgi:hypothetical protein